MMNSNRQTNPIRLLALDMDGTVLLEDKTISPRVQTAISAAVANGVDVVPATGRAAVGIPEAFLSVAKSHYAITANGARVVNLQTGETMLEELIPQDLALIAFDALQKYDCVLDLFQNGKGYSTPANVRLNDRLLPENLREYVSNSRVIIDDMRAFVETQTQGIEKWTMFFGTETERLAAWDEMKALGFEVVSSLPRNMELSAPGVSKGNGLVLLAKLLNLPLSQTMACGDGGNDLTMIAMAGVGVAMENGMDEVKAAADFIAPSNEADGVALAIEHFIL
ncbi:MAG: HAD family hydrolase [Faecalibacterium sp.]